MNAFSTMNFLAVFAAAASSFMLGGLWYSKLLFGDAWNRENGSGPKGEGRHPAAVFGISFLHALIAAFAFAVLFGAPMDAAHAAERGFLLGLGVVGTSFGINYQFASRSPLLWAIDAGYHAVQFTLYGLIIGLWR